MIPTRLRITPGLWCFEAISEEEMLDGIIQMTDLLRKRFRTRDPNCYSPIALGRHLMAISWDKDGIFVPPAPPEILTLLKATSPQGRHEILTLPDLETIPALYEYDLRLAYLWCCKGLPYGSVRHTAVDRIHAHKIRTSWSAPLEWSHIGLLPMRIDGWIYPMEGEGWIDQREAYLADQHLWQMKGLCEGLTWESEGALDRWSNGIQWALRQVEEESLVYRMLRRMTLWTIGSLHRTSTIVSKSDPNPPIDILPSARFEPSNGFYSWTEEQPIRGSAVMYVHPEWTTTIWARCRSRIMSMALQVPREHLIAIRQDALYTSIRQPQWEGQDKVPVGGMRLKWWRDASLDRDGTMLPAPHSIDDLDRLRREE